MFGYKTDLGTFSSAMPYKKHQSIINQALLFEKLAILHIGKILVKQINFTKRKRSHIESLR